MKNRVIAVHLLNDRSGSPLVFGQAVKVLAERDRDVVLYTATPGEDGFLSGLDKVTYRNVFYKWHKNKLVTLMLYLLSQVFLFARLVLALRRDDILYVNTLLPFGAALAGYVRRVPVVYHIHETSIKPPSFRRLLTRVVDVTASKIIFVSSYLQSQFAFPGDRVVVIHNSLPVDYMKTAGENIGGQGEPFTVTMLCSLKAYKGVYEFVNIARLMPDIRFELVLNATEKEVNAFRSAAHATGNCLIYPSQSDTAKFYRRSSVVVNLSDPEQWVETFGMTLLEGMCHGLPVIAPTRGGVLEVVQDGVNGYTINAADEGAVCRALRRLKEQPGLYGSMSAAALNTVHRFSSAAFAHKISLVFPAGAELGQINQHFPVLSRQDLG